MKLNNVQLINPIGLPSFGRKKENKKHKVKNSDKKPSRNSDVTANIWGEKSGSFSPYKSYITYNTYKRSPAAVVKTEPTSPIDTVHPSHFKVCNIDKLTCPSCGKPMLPRPLFEEFKKELDYVTEREYIDVLSDYEPYMAEVESNVFREVKAISDDYPNLTLQQAVLKLKDETLPQLEEIQFKKLNQMRYIAEHMARYENYELMKAINDSESKIKQRGIKHPFKKKTFVAEIENLRIDNYKIKQNLVDIANSFPSSSEAECAWIVKYSGRDNNGKKRGSREIAERFLRNSLTSTDHMLAKDPKMGGKNTISNYITMHCGCNSDKTNKTFMEWFNEKPYEREIYIKKYLEEVQAAIDSGELNDPDYKNYIQEACDTIKKLSGGKLNFIIEKKPVEVD